MNSLLSSLGINWTSLIAQIINFAILIFLLTKFAYKPLIKALNERRDRILSDQKNHDELEKKLAESEKAKEEVLSAARKESEKIIRQSEKNATEIKENIVKEAEKDSLQIRAEAKKQMETEKTKIMEEARKELGSLVLLSVEKTLGDVMDQNIQKKLVEQAVKKI